MYLATHPKMHLFACHMGVWVNYLAVDMWACGCCHCSLPARSEEMWCHYKWHCPMVPCVLSIEFLTWHPSWAAPTLSYFLSCTAAYSWSKSPSFLASVVCPWLATNAACSQLFHDTSLNESMRNCVQNVQIGWRWYASLSLSVCVKLAIPLYYSPFCW